MANLDLVALLVRDYDPGGVASVILNRRESATVIGGLQLLIGDGVRVAYLLGEAFGFDG